MNSVLGEAHARYEACDYAGVVELLGSMPRESLLAEPAQAVLLADAARRIGGVENLDELVAETVEAARHADSAVLCDALNLQGALLFERGRVQAAERTWCDLVEVATAVDQPQFVARASNNLGVAAILTMRLDSAITSFNRAVSAYVRLGYSRGLAQSNTNLGIVFREMDHETEAHASFERALMWGHAAEAAEEIARTKGELALFHLYICRDTETAQATAQETLDDYTALRFPRGIAHASRVLGLISFADRNLAAAEELLNRALTIAREQSIQLLQGETLLALAAVAFRRGNMPEKFTLEEQARAIFSAQSADEWGLQVNKRMQEVASYAPENLTVRKRRRPGDFDELSA